MLWIRILPKHFCGFELLSNAVVTRYPVTVVNHKIVRIRIFLKDSDPRIRLQEASYSRIHMFRNTTEEFVDIADHEPSIPGGSYSDNPIDHIIYFRGQLCVTLTLQYERNNLVRDITCASSHKYILLLGYILPCLKVLPYFLIGWCQNFSTILT